MIRSRIRLAIVVVMLLAACDGRSPASAESPRPTSSPVVPTASVALPGPSATSKPATGWRVVSTFATLGPGHLRDVATFKDRLVAVGATDEGVGVIWSSTDGEVWTSIVGSKPLSGTLLDALAVGEPGIVVVGSNETDAVALFSPDGATWSNPELPGSHPGSSIISVAWGSGAFVGVGGGGEPNAVVAWRSIDGLNWVPTTLFEEGHGASLNSVEAGPNGFLVDGVYDGHPAVWSSADGVSWKRQNLEGGLGDDPGRLRYVQGRYFLPASDGHLWSSADGIEWSRTTVPGFGVRVFDVAAIPGGFVAVGRSSDEEAGQPGSIAVAGIDASNWTLLPRDPALEGALISTLSMAPSGGTLVGVGSSLADESVFLLMDPGAYFKP